MTPHNLPPADSKSFVGRGRELLEIQQNILDPHIPIVTLVGPAGVGKTALALEAAHRVLEQGKFPGGIVWLDCRQMTTLDAMTDTMRGTFALSTSPAVRQQVHAYLRSHPCLLIFDGYDAVAQDMEVLAFLNQLPRPTKALVTSRERVGLLGQERVFVVETRPRAEAPTGIELTITRQVNGRYAVAVNRDFSHTFDIAAVKLPKELYQNERLLYQSELVRSTPRYGQRLFKALFPEGSVAYQALAQLPKAPDLASTLLIVTEDAEAQAVPWEYLHDSNDYLALTHYLVRGIPSERRQGYGGEIPAEALYLVAVPSDPLLFNGRPVTELNVARELEHLKTALQDAEAPYRAVIITPPTLDTLHEALAPRGRHTLVHFIGHGLATEQGAVLLFEDETGAGRAVTAQEFARRVQGYAFLVLLNACESAKTLTTPISNLAYSLATNGLPYTLGMQFTVPDEAALKFSRFFYRFLAQGHPVEEALRQARIALSSLDELANLRGYLLGIPVLYTSLVQGFARFRVEPGKIEIREARPRTEFDTPITEAATFRGRREELVEIGKRLRDGRKVLTLVGPGGIGKSALARQAAQRFAWRFPAGILGLSLEHLPSKEEFVVRLGHWLLGKRSEELKAEEREREVIDTFKGQERLLVLDNYETLLDSLSASSSETKKKAQALGQFIRRLAGGKGVLMATTRERPTDLPGEGQPLGLLGLEAEAAVALFHDHAGEKYQEANKSLVAELVDALGYHPLAIELLAKAYAEGHESLAEVLESWPERLQEARDRYKGEEERHVTLTACFEHSYRSLTTEAQKLFPELTVFEAPFLPQAVEAVFSLKEAGNLLNLLFRKSLLQRQEVNGLTFYFFHPMARWYAEEKAKEADLAPLQEALGRAYLNFAKGIYGKLDPENSLVARVILPDLKRAVTFLPDKERGQLAFHLGWLLRIFGDLDTAMQLYQEAKAIDEQLGDLHGKSATLHGMAYIYRTRGELDTAMDLYQEALAIKKQSGDLHGKSAILHDMAYIYRMRGELDTAMQLYREAKIIFEQLGDLRSKSATLHDTAYIYRMRGELDRAMELYQEALDIREQLGDLHGKASTMHQMGYIHQAHGELDRAMRLYQQVLAIDEQLGDLRGKSATLHDMAGIHQVRGELDRAMELYQEAKAIEEQLGDLHGRSVTLHAMAYIYRMRGELDRAMELYQEAKAIEEQLGDLRGKSATLAMRGQLLAQAGEKELALRDFVEARTILTRMGAADVEKVADIIANFRAQVGDEEFKILWQKVTGQQEVPEWLEEPRQAKLNRLLALAAKQEEEKNWQAASETYRQALSRFETRKMSDEERWQYAETALHLGICLRQDNQWGPAVEQLQEAFQAFKKLGDFRGQGQAYLEIARAYRAMNSYDLAILHYKDAYRLFKRAGDIAMAASAKEEAGNLQVYLRAFPNAIADLKEAARLYTEANIPSSAATALQTLELARESQK